MTPQSLNYQISVSCIPANNGVGGVVIAGAVISSFRRRGDGARRWSGCVIAVSQRRRFGDSNICRFREPAGRVIS